MSFGFGVGDFLAAIELAGKLKSRWDDAPAEYEAISNEYVFVGDFSYFQP